MYIIYIDIFVAVPYFLREVVMAEKGGQSFLMGEGKELRLLPVPPLTKLEKPYYGCWGCQCDPDS